MHPARFYKLLSFCMSFGGCLPVGVYLPYLYHLGLGKDDIFLLNAVYWMTISVFEVLTGTWADGKSRSWSVKVGLSLCAAGSIIYLSAGYAHARWWIMTIALAAEIIEGVGAAFLSGALQAWLADALERRGEEKQIKSTYASAQVAGNLGALLGGSVSFVLPFCGYATAWISRAVIIFLALLTCIKWMNGEGEPIHRVTELKALKDSWRLLTTNPMLQWIAAGSALFGLVLAFNLTWVPHFSAGNSWWHGVIVWACCSSGLALGAKIIGKWGISEETEIRSYTIALGLTGLSLMALSASSDLVLPVAFIFLHEIGRGMFHPLTEGSIYSRVGSSYKATYGSLNSMLSRLGHGSLLFVGWLAMRLTGSEAPDAVIWLLAGAILASATTVLWLLRPKHALEKA